MPKRRGLFDTGLVSAAPKTQTNENMGMGQEQPVRRPMPNAAADQSQRQQQPQPQLQPIPPPIGMTPLNMSMPGAGGSNTQDLLDILMGLRQGQGYPNAKT